MQKSDELYDKLFQLKNNFNDELNLNLYNYTKINKDFIESIKNKYIENIQVWLNNLEQLDLVDSNSQTLLEPLCDIICDRDLCIFKLENIYPDSDIQNFLLETNFSINKYISRRLLDSDSYDKFKYILSESKYKYKSYITDFILNLEKFAKNLDKNLDENLNKNPDKNLDENPDENADENPDENPDENLDENLDENYNLEESINDIIETYIEEHIHKNININTNTYMKFTLWDQNVVLLDVVKNNEKIGYIYMDIYSRPNKKYLQDIFLLNYKYNSYLPEYCINLNFDINKDNITKTQYDKLKNIIADCINKY